MARCPYAPHRLVLGDRGSCGRCGGDVRLYAALRWLPELLFNDAHRLLEQGEAEAAAAVLQRVLGLRADFPEAHWLMAVVEHRRGRMEEARLSLERAHSLGAKVQISWLDPKPIPPDDTARLKTVEEIPVAGETVEEFPDVTVVSGPETASEIPDSPTALSAVANQNDRASRESEPGRIAPRAIEQEAVGSQVSPGTGS
jgi:hypothetical protein